MKLQKKLDKNMIKNGCYYWLSANLQKNKDRAFFTTKLFLLLKKNVFLMSSEALSASLLIRKTCLCCPYVDVR